MKGKGGAFSSLGGARVLETFPSKKNPESSTQDVITNSPQVRESNSLGIWIPDSGFRIPGTGFWFQSLVGFWIPRTIIQIPKARILDTTSKFSRIPDQQAKFSGFTYMWQSQSNTSKLY